MTKQMINYLKEEISKVKEAESKNKIVEQENNSHKENEEKFKEKLKYYVKKNRGLEEQLNSVQLENSDLQDEIVRLRQITEEMENDFYDHEQSFQICKEDFE